MSQVKIQINGVEFSANEGESVLEVARGNGVFIPAICYLTNCSPTLACRLCLVEIDGKRLYACNAKVKEGMSIITNSDEIVNERRSIMEVYDVNHPLACGTCDQSGECELQNCTLEMGVETQNFCTPDTSRPSYDWGFIHYDSSLCIVCERCVTVCKDMIGDANLKTIPRGGTPLAKELKDEMPKDAYAVFNKMQKSLIGRVSEDNCGDCGECAAVCPVGALVSSDFQYKSNSWELRKIPAANPHSSDCSLMYYDVKHTSIDESEEKIYRVSSDYNFAPLHGGARFGYDFENKVEKKDEKAFLKLVNLIQNKKADYIKFNSFITNEEALILQNIKEKFGLKLINDDGYYYLNFLKEFAKTSGKSLYSGNLANLKKSDFVISVGSFLRSDSPVVGYFMNNALSMNKGAGLYFHPIFDEVVQGFSKNIHCLSYEPFREEAVLFWILSFFGENLPESLNEYFSSIREKVIKTIEEDVKEEQEVEVVKKVKDEDGNESEVKELVKKQVTKKVKKDIEVEVSKLWDIMGLSPQDELVSSLIAKKEKFTLIIGEDLYAHKNAKNLAKLTGLIEKFTKFEVLIIPSQTNTLGVSLICDLDESCEGFGIGYNQRADFTYSALGDGDLDAPALNQQEGTFTNIDKRVVPTNAALAFNGYCLNDIANALGFDELWTINYTEHLPKNRGYKSIKFDDLPNEFLNDGFENRGYLLEIYQTESEVKFDEAKKVRSPKELIYKANPIMQFSPFTNKAHQLKDKAYLYASSEFLEKYKLENLSEVKLANSKDETLLIQVKLDKSIKGNYAYLPSFDTEICTDMFFDGYRFAQAKIVGADNE